MRPEQIQERVDTIRKEAKSPLEVQLMSTQLMGEILGAGLENLRYQFTTNDSCFENVAAFHRKFKLGYDGFPRHLPKDLSDFRVRFMHEELKEYEDAVASGNLEKQFDALIDLVYVALGTAYLQGFPFNAGWDRVQAANMQKIRTARPTERGGGYDVVKPKGWVPPMLTDLVNPIP